ncbi:hypothetical protein P1P68_00440 [Streptomyces scabiei]|uniref:hypothetical protein n=1 Tax=Streptomyces scabiei TaxID=1930 RepID=UPI00299068FD|nr:hypothetical protein [Streptomyces scabiei]MDW8803317.1 hypothetical protein [Streptomyces scabiei]
MKRIPQSAARFLVAGAASAAMMLGATGVAGAATDLPSGAKVTGKHPVSYKDAIDDAALQCASYAVKNVSGGKSNDGNFYAFATCV